MWKKEVDLIISYQIIMAVLRQNGNGNDAGSLGGQHQLCFKLQNETATDRFSGQLTFDLIFLYINLNLFFN